MCKYGMTIVRTAKVQKLSQTSGDQPWNEKVPETDLVSYSREIKRKFNPRALILSSRLFVNTSYSVIDDISCSLG